MIRVGRAAGTQKNITTRTVMDSSMHVNWLAILVAALSAFGVGSIWYGPLFAKAWMREAGVSPEKARSANIPKLFGTVFVLNLIAAGSLFIGPSGSWRFGLFAGFMTGLTFISTALGVIYLFESRSLRLWLINGGYQVVSFSVMGTILGAWP
jgi:hypothetical protein